MNIDKYYWSNRASVHHMERLRDFLPEGSDPNRILLAGTPRYVEHIEESLPSADGHRRYDMLIEYDIYHPSHGIYFGCRSTTLPEYDHDAETTEALKDWNNVLPLALRRLNNVFPEKDFSCRLRNTDNANDRTFWPFWISLHEDESPHKVACIALRIMAAAYKDYHVGKGKDIKLSDRNVITYPILRIAFTREAYESLLNRIAENVSMVSVSEHRNANIDRAIAIFTAVMEGAERIGLLERSRAYDYAWQLSRELSKIEFTAFIKALFEEMTRILGVGCQIKIPWQHLIRLFLRYDESPFKEQIKTLRPQQDTMEKMSKLISDILSSHGCLSY